MTRARRNVLNPIFATISRADANVVGSTTGSGEKNGAWLPIGSAKQLVGDVPESIELIGEKFVVWRNGTTWSVMRDVCPHRLAPLSQGRVDPTTGCIECPYHGWQFASNGACTKIPQLPADQRRGALGDDAMDRTGATSFPVRMTGDMIWAFLPLPPGQASYYPALPEEVLPLLVNLTFNVRDLPYSFDFLLENFMDPAHIPFAHHSLQGRREDGSPIPMEPLTGSDDAGLCEVRFQDVVRGTAR
eukprot:CAMPEP_0172166996 /NCGR_PEP_ID=MMETSP1050-20130122/9318_1 /TAXON_ID=233186 /ORGANISM="Cryptomonas curvata, Strain CCAP979/52" /LENGTH=244 /DNA_ID=CAMNT_0012837721 /DNA_START=174 /DNA_END=905 /DNA_ORIENTATION=-